MSEDNPTFAQRYGYGPHPLATDIVPKWIRGEFVFKFLRQLHIPFRNGIYADLRPIIWHVTSKEPPDPTLGDHWISHEYDTIKQVAFACEWWLFFEICERTYKQCYQRFGRKSATGLEDEANKLFASDLLAWRFEDGLIVPAHPAEITAVFDEAKALLADPKYTGPNEQFRKANGHLAEKPHPDTENCVKDAVGALEGVARIVAGQPKATLGDLTKKGVLKSSIPPRLMPIIEQLYVYRGSEPGVAHAKTDASMVGFEEADWVLSMCATAMIYLMKKFPASEGLG